MKAGAKKILVGVAAVLGLGAMGAGGFVQSQVGAFDESMAKVHDVAPPAITASKDPAVIARGKHLVDVVGCSSKDCHGSDLAGGQTLVMGPLATLTGPNITPGGVLSVYEDGEIARVIRHGVRKDGRSLAFMPSQELSWLPDDDLTAIVSYLRTVPPVEKANGPNEVGVLGKVLDRQGQLPLDVARAVEGVGDERAGKPEPTAEYGRFLARGCTGCHGSGLSGGAIPGAPSDLPIPLNITPHETGIAGWSYEDFDALMTKGEKKKGGKLDPFMPIEGFSKMDETEKRALYAYLMSQPATPFGGR